MSRRPVTPNRMKKERGILRDLRADFSAALEKARAAKAAWRAVATAEMRFGGPEWRAYCAREDAAWAAWEARDWVVHQLRKMADMEAAGVVKGSAWCPDAQERAIREGRMRR